jgi:membrane fusion protein, multidrug efflux system
MQGRVESLNRGVQPQTGDGAGGPGLPVVGRTLNWVIVAQRFPVWIRLLDPPLQDLRIGATVSVRVEHDARQ